MATLTLSLTSTPVTGSKSYALSDADVDRWVAAMRVVFKMPTQTKSQVLSAWADSVVEHAKFITHKVERGVAAKAAGDAVTQIVVS